MTLFLGACDSSFERSKLCAKHIFKLKFTPECLVFLFPSILLPKPGKIKTLILEWMEGPFLKSEENLRPPWGWVGGIPPGSLLVSVWATKLGCEASYKLLSTNILHFGKAASCSPPPHPPYLSAFLEVPSPLVLTVVN